MCKTGIVNTIQHVHVVGCAGCLFVSFLIIIMIKLNNNYHSNKRT